MKRIMTALVAVIALAGCGHDVYQRANTTDTQYIQDENACFNYAEEQPLAAVGGSAHDQAYSMNIEKERKDIRSCMVARGYTLEPKWPFGPYGISQTRGPNPATMPLATTR
ncbi:MAG: hypothetical protein ACXWLT_13860 [Rhizomicrobium sp.]